jgi:3-methyl-2-oxobutanoate hydroxymethyltransferase
MNRKVTVPALRKRKVVSGDAPITMLTAYDHTMARILDAAGIDILLVGDSLGMVVQGAENTLEVTLDQMVYHTRCVASGAARAHVVGDLPFGSYHASPVQAVESAVRLVKEGRAEAVKLEGGAERADAIRAIVDAQIPVMAHVGLTPQSVHRIGGFKVQGRGEEAAERVLADARAVEAAGAYALVLEGIPSPLARRITEALRIPTIGIGAGPDCDGQVLVSYDLLGANPGFNPKFVKRFADLHGVATEAVRAFIAEVQAGTFPSQEHSFKGAGKAKEAGRTSMADALSGLYGGEAA